MLKNYIKIAFRNLLKNRVYSFVNIGGLAVGMAVAMLIGLWIRDELSFNKNHKNYDTIGLIRSLSTDPSTNIKESSESLPIPLAASVKENYKHYFDKVLLAWWFGNYSLKFGDKNLNKTGEFIDSEAPEMLSLRMLKGSYESLKDPHSIILSKTTAEAIFGNRNPINQNLKIDNKIDVKVTGVYEDLPKNSRFGEIQFFSTWDLWMMSNEWIKNNQNNWQNTSFNIYVELNPNVSMSTAQAGIKDFYYKNGPKEFSEIIQKYKLELLIYPMKEWHLYSEFKEGRPAGGRITFVWLFGVIGIFVLILACINFTNLSTARSEKRAKEVGIRKAIGSIRGQLIQQFLSESFLVVLLAFLLSIALVSLSLSWFNELADKNMVLPFTKPVFWMLNLAFITFTGFLAGLYPAFFLSSFQAIKVLKGTIRLGRFASVPRKILVVVQFTVSVVLIIGTIIVYQQIQYARNRPVGYNREGLVYIPMNDPNYYGKQEVIKQELLNTGTIAKIAISSAPITAVWNNNSGFNWKGKDPEHESNFGICNITHDYGKTVGWQLVAGRDFSKTFATDSVGVIINEAAAKYMGLKEPVGEFIKAADGSESWQIIGVTKDIIMQSPYEPIKQTLFYLDHNYSRTSQLTIRIKPGVSANTALEKIETVLKGIVPSALFEYKFIDQEYGKKFNQEERVGKLASFFALLAIFISCLGLFGLSSFVAEQRTKEIGIRKVLGASVSSLWGMLSKDFVVLIIISCLIATPIAYYFMNEWLAKYNYRTEISWWIFVVTGAGALGITLLTVSYQAVKAALMNPIKSLKTE